MYPILSTESSYVCIRSSSGSGSSGGAVTKSVGCDVPGEGEGGVSRDVSTKIAAGMDRWQTTLEDMMHLRSSSNHVFKDNYWVKITYNINRQECSL